MKELWLFLNENTAIIKDNFQNDQNVINSHSSLCEFLRLQIFLNN